MRLSQRFPQLLIAFSGLLVVIPPAPATVFISEVSVNPPGSLDDFREYIELQGTPGKKLDGYAIAFLNGSEEKYYPTNSIPPLPDPKPEIDEFFSLDGLALGANGLLVIALGNIDSYPECLSDTEFFGPWFDLWNGGLDAANRLSNDGSNTILLIRHRPGRTEADPTNPGGLRWGKALYQDFQITRNVIDPQDGVPKDLWGNGNMDRGESNGLNGVTQDVLGAKTVAPEDDLEIVDEVSYESARGWEYDTDDRKVDVGSGVSGLPERRVHALDDPQGFNPDALTRVDYRVAGPGWVPASGGVGELPNGRNWQDTATEQWIRGENLVLFGDDGPEIFYSNDANPNPDSIQPYLTNVPKWLRDGVSPDYNFSGSNTYRLLAGRVNPLAVPFIPGDSDRDGDCDAQDIAKIAEVFGDDDWVFSNAFPEAPETNEGDPTTQIRPWDVDASGNRGIEASDLQWTLNFQGNTNGRIVGLHYDSPTPATAGVVLNPNTGVTCSVTTALEFPCGSTELHFGDFFDLLVFGQVTSGARTTPSQANGIMQFVHDVTISNGGILRAIDVTPMGAFSLTREDLATNLGVSGDRGIATVNGYTTSFLQGVSTPVPMYRVRFQAIGAGSARIDVTRAAIQKFAGSAPLGIKVGHTNQEGNPSGVTYPVGLQLFVAANQPSLGDCDNDALVSYEDHACFVDCMTGPAAGDLLARSPVDLDADNDIDLADFAIFMRIFGD